MRSLQTSDCCNSAVSATGSPNRRIASARAADSSPSRASSSSWIAIKWASSSSRIRVNFFGPACTRRTARSTSTMNAFMPALPG